MGVETILAEFYTLLAPHFSYSADSFEKKFRKMPTFAKAVAVLLGFEYGGNNTKVAQAFALFEENAGITPSALYMLPPDRIMAYAAPAGNTRTTGPRLLHFLSFLIEGFEHLCREPWQFEDGSPNPDFDDLDLAYLKKKGTADLKRLLLKVRGIGLETAESLLLFAFERPVFCTGAGVYRIMHRHGLIEEEASHDELAELFNGTLPDSLAYYAEFNRLLTQAAKNYCKQREAACSNCPLAPLLERG